VGRRGLSNNFNRNQSRKGEGRTQVLKGLVLVARVKRQGESKDPTLRQSRYARRIRAEGKTDFDSSILNLNSSLHQVKRMSEGRIHGKNLREIQFGNLDGKRPKLSPTIGKI